MNLSFVLLFFGVGGAAFFLLLREDKVRSVAVLRFAWCCLGLALLLSVTFSTFHTVGDPGASVAVIWTGNISWFLLSLAWISLVFAVHPVNDEPPDSRLVQQYVRRPDDPNFADWLQQRGAAPNDEGAAASPEPPGDAETSAKVAEPGRKEETQDREGPE